LSEPISDSPTSSEVVAGIEADDDFALEILYKHSAELLATLSTEERPRFLDILERLTDKMDLREAQRTAATAELQREVHERKIICRPD
jgi:hypothetical protein